MKPEIVCLCGSTRFADEFREANQELTLQGKIVLSVGFFGHASVENRGGVELTEEIKTKLDELHLRKIDLADGCLFLNVKGYLGTSSRRELAYAIARRKKVEFLEPAAGETFMEENSHELGRLVAGFVS